MISTSPLPMAWTSGHLSMRYAVHLADLNPVGGEIRKVRPVVVVSQDEMNQYLDTVVVCPLTTALHPKWRSVYRSSVRERSGNCRRPDTAISKQRIGRLLDRLSAEEAAQLRRIITEMYGG